MDKIFHRVQRLKPLVAGVTLVLMASMQPACDTVPMPANAEDYVAPGVRVVAAGLLRGDGSHSGPVHNGLKIGGVKSGELLMTFDGYQMPDGQSQYVVKIMPVNSSERASLLSVYFIEYVAAGMRFNVRRGNTNLSVADLQVAQFMVEVSVIR